MAAKDNLILDASVIIKWFIDEEDDDKALSILDAFQNNQITVAVPTLLFYELGNILVSKKASADMVEKAMVILQNLDFRIDDIGLSSFLKIHQNSVDYSITFYDATYITLLEKENCQFITADNKLFQKINKAFSGAKLLSN